MCELARTAWTVWADHYGTGEGLRIMACISLEATIEVAKRNFGEAFDPHFLPRSFAERGVVRNQITQMLWPEETLRRIEQACAVGGTVRAASSYYINVG